MNKLEARLIARQITHQLISNYLEDGGSLPNDGNGLLFGVESEQDARKVDAALRAIAERIAVDTRNAPHAR